MLCGNQGGEVLVTLQLGHTHCAHHARSSETAERIVFEKSISHPRRFRKRKNDCHETYVNQKRRGRYQWGFAKATKNASGF